MKKTRRQLRKMADEDIVAYLLKNHYWHIVTFYQYENLTCPGGSKYFKIAGFRLSQDFFISAYGGRWADTYYSRTDYTLFDVKTREYVHISTTDGEKLYNRLKRQYKTRHARRIILLTLACGACIWAIRTIHKSQDTDTNTPPSTSNTAQAITSNPCDEMNTFYYYQTDHQH